MFKVIVNYVIPVVRRNVLFDEHDLSVYTLLGNCDNHNSFAIQNRKIAILENGLYLQVHPPNPRNPQIWQISLTQHFP